MMKKILILIFAVTSFASQAQTASVEDSMYELQAGFLGTWFHSEIKLARKIALRSELGLEGGFWAGSVYDKTGFLLAPVITLEPRWYYNLDKRANKMRRIRGNSSNFVSLKASYRPDWFVISNYDNIRVISNISVVPTWGFRRNFGSNFHYEFAIGLGYGHSFAKKAGYLENESYLDGTLRFVVGYRF